MANTKSIRDVLRPEDKSIRELSAIHDLQNEHSWVDMVLSIAEYGYKNFFSDYLLYLIVSYPSRVIADLYWEEAFDIFINPYYAPLWMGLEAPAKEKKRSSKYEWYDNLVLGHI
jgi:hypothetical protein